MRYVSGLVACVVTTGLVLAGGATQEQYEKILNDAISQISAAADVLKSVKDKDTAEAAKTKLRAIAEKLKAVQAAGDKLGKPDPRIEGELKGKYKSKLDAAVQRISAEALRLSTVEGGKELLLDLQSLFPKSGPGKKKTAEGK